VQHLQKEIDDLEKVVHELKYGTPEDAAADGNKKPDGENEPEQNGDVPNGDNSNPIPRQIKPHSGNTPQPNNDLLNDSNSSPKSKHNKSQNGNSQQQNGNNPQENGNSLQQNNAAG